MPGSRSSAPAPARAHPGPVRALGDRLLDLAFPARCPGCGREGAPICDRCRPALFGHLARPAGTLIGLPSEIPSPIVQLEWCGAFEGVIRTSLHGLKYSGERRLATLLGAAIAERWRHAGGGGDVLVPVPIHSERQRQRGYDQAVLLAQSAGVALGMPVAACLVRTRATTAQFQLDRPQRAANVARAFQVKRGAEWSIAGRWAVLVDDVTTTGSTLASCARVLLHGGALAVSAVTVAREQ